MCVHCTYSSFLSPFSLPLVHFFFPNDFSFSHYFSLNLDSTYERKYICLSSSVLIHFPNVILFFLDNFTVYIYHSLSFNEHCVGLNENGPHRLIYLNIWFSVGWKELGGLALLEVGWGGVGLLGFKSSWHSQLAFSACLCIWIKMWALSSSTMHASLRPWSLAWGLCSNSLKL